MQSNQKFLIVIAAGVLCYLFVSLIYNQRKLVISSQVYYKATTEYDKLTEENRRAPTQPVLTPTTTATTTREAINSQVKWRFDYIYKNQIWGEAGGGSGPGSTVDYTESARKILAQVIDEYAIESMLDAPCGSFVWMPLLLESVKKKRGRTFRYHGVDVVESVVNAARLKWTNETDWRFSVCDFSAQPLPDHYELVFSRDALQHLSYEKIFYSLRAYSRVRGARFLLVGSYLGKIGANKNINVGDYFPINLLKPPFNLTQHVRIYHENRTDYNTPKSLILYDIPNYLSKVDFEKIKIDLGIK